MREIKVETAIIHLPDAYVLQRRTKDNSVGEINKLGLYGGKIDNSQDNERGDAVSREVHEETGALFPVCDFHYLGFVHSFVEKDGIQVLTEAEIFSLMLPHGFPAEQFTDSVVMDHREISRARALGALSSVASLSLSKFQGV